MRVVLTENEYLSSKYSTKEWEKSVIITRYEHDFENKTYTIDYKEIK